MPGDLGPLAGGTARARAHQLCSVARGDSDSTSWTRKVAVVPTIGLVLGLRDDAGLPGRSLPDLPRQTPPHSALTAACRKPLRLLLRNHAGGPELRRIDVDWRGSRIWTSFAIAIGCPTPRRS